MNNKSFTHDESANARLIEKLDGITECLRDSVEQLGFDIPTSLQDDAMLMAQISAQQILNLTNQLCADILKKRND